MEGASAASGAAAVRGPRVGRRARAGVGVAEAAAPGPGAAVAGPPRHRVPAPGRRRAAGRAAQPGGQVPAAYATGLPRRRAQGHAAVTPRHEGARQDVHHLVRSGAKGDHHRAGAGAAGSVEQVRPLREGGLRAAPEAAAQRREQPRGREMGQAQEDHHPCLPPREAQAHVAGLRRVLRGSGEQMGRFGWRRWPAARDRCLAGDAEADRGCHLPRRVRQQLPRRQEDLPAPGGAGSARHDGRQQAARPWLLVAAYQNQPEDEADCCRDRRDPERNHREKGELLEDRQGDERRPSWPAAGVEHGAVRRPRRLELRHVHRRRDRGVQAVLLRRHGDHVGAAHVDDGGSLHAPGVAGPREGGGASRLQRRQNAGLRRHQPPENRDHGAARGAAAVHAAAGGPPQDVQADGARRRQVPGGRDADAAAAVRPPRQGRVGRGRGRVQAGEVRGGNLQGVLPLRRGPAHLHRPELRAAGGQDGARHDPAELRVRALAVILARAVPRHPAAAGARRAGQAQEAPVSCLCMDLPSSACTQIFCGCRNCLQGTVLNSTVAILNFLLQCTPIANKQNHFLQKNQLAPATLWVTT